MNRDLLDMPLELDLTPPPDRYKVAFSVLGLPVAKGRARVTRNGTYTPKKTRVFEADVAATARDAMGPLKPCVGSVFLSLVVFLPVPKGWPKHRRNAALAGLVHPVVRPDLDNYEKAVTDALNGIVYDDDSQVCDVVKSKRYAATPRVCIEVHAMEGFTAYRLQPKKPKGMQSTT
jgi:Holliday junction resolvase RusA-like endonuclease